MTVSVHVKAVVILEALVALALPWCSLAATNAVSEIAGGLPPRAAAWTAAQMKRLGDASHAWVRPGIVADQSAGHVLLLAAPHGLEANINLEFMLVGPQSGHAYEAFAHAFARPSDVREALQFAGMVPGRPVDWRRQAFWPKGERILATVRCLDPGFWTAPVRMERLVWNADSQVPMRADGLIFTGSRMEVLADGTERLRADVYDPHSIIANYNEPDTVIDLPRIAPQNEVYAANVMNPEYVLPTNVLVEIVLEPERTEGGPRVLDVDVLFASSPSNTLADTVCEVRKGAAPPDGVILQNPAGVLEMLSAYVTAGRDPYVRLGFSPGLTLGLVRNACTLFAAAEGEDGIRMEPAMEGSLFFKAYLPDPANRKREDRVSQPWELHLNGTGTNLTVSLVSIEEIWVPDQVDPHLVPTEWILESPAVFSDKLDVALRDELKAAIGSVADAEAREALHARLAGLSDQSLWREPGNTLRSDIDFLSETFAEDKVQGLRVILVFADPGLKHGVLMDWLDPVRDTHPLVHVYLDGAGH